MLAVSRRKLLRNAGAAPVILSLGALSTTIKPPAASASDVAGMLVFLDPGHNGLNDSSSPARCPTAGAVRNNAKRVVPPPTTAIRSIVQLGLTLRIADSLTQLGVRTAMSRDNDIRWAVRGSARGTGKRHAPDAIVSIHADGRTAIGGGAFTSTTPSPPLNDAQSGAAVQFATRHARDQLVGRRTPALHLFEGGNGLYGALRPRRPQFVPVPVDPRRARQHEQPATRPRQMESA